MTPYELELSAYLQEFLTPARRQRFAEVLAMRTQWVRVVVEDLYIRDNASAIMRSCDAFGVQHMHAIESSNRFATNSQIAMGTEQWVTLHRHLGENSRKNCFTELREQGYAIAATVLHHESQPVQTLSLEQPVALIFGNEREGVSKETINEADYLVHLPMYGFVESFNVSVAAGLCLQSLRDRLADMEVDLQLSQEEQAELLLHWTRQSVPNVQAIEKRFKKDRTG